MDSLIIRGVRCFRDEASVRLAPLTLLVGENSTGKSTLLGLSRIAWDMAFARGPISFNEEPFFFGAYDDLAHYHGGQGKRARTFAVGFTATLAPRPESAGRVHRRDLRQSKMWSGKVYLITTFKKTKGQPALASFSMKAGECSEFEFEVKIDDNDVTNMMLRTSGHQHEAGIDFMLPLGGDLLSIPSYLVHTALSRRRASEGETSIQLGPEVLEFLEEFAVLGQRLRRSFGLHRPYAIAPIRTKPKRTYDLLGEAPSPEGDHVPMVLARLRAEKGPAWEALSETLRLFGASSGLFESVAVRRYGGKEAAPFQIRAKLAGQRKEVNLADLGYGVSQILPVIVDVTTGSGDFFLMQQPEVHLHPKAQAALGTFLCRLVARSSQRFLVETHSDYIVDRVRLEIREGRLTPEQVSILFFERVGAAVRIEEITIDESGNVVNPPESYRRFFIDETMSIVCP